MVIVEDRMRMNYIEEGSERNISLFDLIIIFFIIIIIRVIRLPLVLVVFVPQTRIHNFI